MGADAASKTSSLRENLLEGSEALPLSGARTIPAVANAAASSDAFLWASRIISSVALTTVDPTDA